LSFISRRASSICSHTQARAQESSQKQCQHQNQLCPYSYDRQAQCATSHERRREASAVSALYGNVSINATVCRYIQGQPGHSTLHAVHAGQG
jgi:hypothetical protein